MKTPFIWYELSKQHKRNSTGVAHDVLRLCYRSLVKESGLEKPHQLGFVSISQAGNFWWWIDSPSIEHNTSAFQVYSTLEEAQEGLMIHVKKELNHLKELGKPVFYHVPPDLRIDRNTRKARGIINADSRSKEESFTEGMLWSMKNTGIPQRPEWASFIVENKDGSLTWFENLPQVDEHKGVWKSTGRSQKVKLFPKRSWDFSIKRIR